MSDCRTLIDIDMILSVLVVHPSDVMVAVCPLPGHTAAPPLSPGQFDDLNAGVSMMQPAPSQSFSPPESVGATESEFSRTILEIQR